MHIKCLSGAYFPGGGTYMAKPRKGLREKSRERTKQRDSAGEDQFFSDGREREKAQPSLGPKWR